MGVLPESIEQLLDTALVSELTVIDPTGRPVTHPLIPLYDGEMVYLTSSILFSKKLEHIKANPKVSVSISDPIAVQVERFARATIQGDATVDDSDLHCRLGGARAAAVAQEGARDRHVPRQARRAAAVLRARR